VYFSLSHIKIAFESTLQSCGVASSSDGQTKEVVVVGGVKSGYLSTVEIFNVDDRDGIHQIIP
jgi:hypothetical protein